MKKIFYIILGVSLLLSSCSESSGDVSGVEGSSSSGQGGSLARFAISGDYLYTVDKTELEVYDVSQGKPTFLTKTTVGFGIETIFPKGNLLFLGSETGMFIYDVSTPTSPVLLSNYQHVFACDPVVADDNYAYITLRSTNSWCGRNTNELIVANIQDLKNPFTESTYPMVGPQGLGISDTTLFVCDNGLKVLNVKDVKNIKELKTFGIDCHDVITLENHLLVIGSSALYQYTYDGENLNLESTLSVAQ